MKTVNKIAQNIARGSALMVIACVTLIIYSSVKAQSVEDVEAPSVSAKVHKADILVFPNPVREKLTVQITDSGSEFFTVTLSNNAGAVVEKAQLHETGEKQLIEWDVQPYAAGIYFVTVRSSDIVKTYRVYKE
jgi:hypothetical protein